MNQVLSMSSKKQNNVKKSLDVKLNQLTLNFNKINDGVKTDTKIIPFDPSIRLRNSLLTQILNSTKSF